MWGAISTGLFATPQLVGITGVGQAGLFYGGGLGQLGVQILGVVGTFSFVFTLSFSILWGMKKLMGLRVTKEEEVMGLDLSEHGTYGYPEHMKWRMKTSSSSSMKVKENDEHEGHDLLVTRPAAVE
ncbi:Ammonium transporter NrgA [compost metagenome]